MKGKEIFEKNKQSEQIKQIKILPIKGTDEIAKGVYSNVTFVHHTENEFVIDFISQLVAEPQIVSRIILSPAHMKLLIVALQENFANFEKKLSELKKAPRKKSS